MDELHGWNGVADWILRLPFCSCSSDLFTLVFPMFSTVADSPSWDCSFCCVFLALISAPVVFDIRHTFFPGHVLPLWSPVLAYWFLLSRSDCSLIADCSAGTVLETLKAPLWLGCCSNILLQFFQSRWILPPYHLVQALRFVPFRPMSDSRSTTGPVPWCWALAWELTWVTTHSLHPSVVHCYVVCGDGCNLWFCRGNTRGAFSIILSRPSRQTLCIAMLLSWALLGVIVIFFEASPLTVLEGHHLL